MSNRIVFMGTPDFAVGCLKALVENGLNVVAVVTMPDKPRGRGQKMLPSPVKEYALAASLPVLQPTNLRDEHFLQALEACRSDLQVVVAFRMLPRAVWAMPPLGTFNLHASLLPRYRGAAPIQRAIWNGETVTGVTTFLLDDNMDTGGILYQQQVSIDPGDNAGTLHDKLLAAGAPLVVKTAQDLFSGTVQPKAQKTMPTCPGKNNDTAAEQKQQTETVPTAPKIFKDDCYLDPTRTAHELHLQVRALSPYPAAFTTLTSKGTGEKIILKVFESAPETMSAAANTAKEAGILTNSFQQGNIVITSDNALLLVCANNTFLSLKDVQLSGKQRVRTEPFLRGFRPELFSNVSNTHCY
jgi:methionyl-tRNA formyltransferase